MSANAPMTGRSATGRRSVATPLRTSRRASFPSAPQDELNGPTPRTLELCDCGHSPVCAVATVSILPMTSTAVIESSPRLCRPVELSDLASPGPSSPGQAPTECAVPDAALEGELVQEIPVRGSGLCFSQGEHVHDPRMRHGRVPLPFIIIPTSTSSTGGRAGSFTEVADPRIRHQSLLAEAHAPRTSARKRPRSPTPIPEAPQFPRSPGHVVSCRAGRYRSPTPVPEPCHTGPVAGG